MAESALPANAGKNPGPLRSQSRLAVHTRYAQRLIDGRGEANKPPILGLLAFGRRMRQIWLSAEHDDPYADWYLYQIEGLVDITRQLIQDHRRQLQGLLENIPKTVHIAVSESLEPVEVELAFANPYGYMGAYLVADFDELARLVFTARHAGCIDRKFAEAMLFKSASAVRRTFQKSAEWRYTGVTRTDIKANSPLAQKAIEAMRIVPLEHLQGDVRARCAPIIRSTALNPLGEEADDSLKLQSGMGRTERTDDRTLGDFGILELRRA
jgi:integrating conjugative element protein (TIGR03761 family)